MKKFIVSLLLCIPIAGFAQTPEELRAKTEDFSVYADDLNSGQIATLGIEPARADNPGNFSVFDHLASLNRADSGDVTISRSGNAILVEKSAISGRKDAYSDTYEYGDVVFLTGHLENSWTKSEWTRYYGVAKWLAQKGFRVIMNPVAMIVHIKEAVQNDKTKVIIWSSHASRNGTIYDSGHNAVPPNVFAENAGPNFRQIIVSACFGNVMVTKYEFPEGLKKTYWSGTTDADDLFDYLYNTWDPRTLK
ncbi:MAG: hypothetical protein ABIG11_08025 [bacterium]